MMRILGVVAALSLAACAQPSSPTLVTPSPSSQCDMAFEVASASSDVEELRAALEQAIDACQTAEEWNRASQARVDELQGIDPQQFLVDRCLNGPPDLADSTLCKTLSVDR